VIVGVGSMVWYQDPLVAGLSYYTCCTAGEVLPSHPEMIDDEHDSYEEDEVMLYDVMSKERSSSVREHRQHDHCMHAPQHLELANARCESPHDPLLWEILRKDDPEEKDLRMSSIGTPTTPTRRKEKTDHLPCDVPLVSSSSSSSSQKTSSSSNSSSYLSPVPTSPPESDLRYKNQWRSDRKKYEMSHIQPRGVDASSSYGSSFIPQKRKIYTSTTPSTSAIQTVASATNIYPDQQDGPRHVKGKQEVESSWSSPVQIAPLSPTTSAVMCGFPWMMCIYDLDSLCLADRSSSSVVASEQYNFTKFLMEENNQYHDIANVYPAYYATEDTSFSHSTRWYPNYIETENSGSSQSLPTLHTPENMETVSGSKEFVATTTENEGMDRLLHQSRVAASSSSSSSLPDTTTTISKNSKYCLEKNRFCDFANEHNIEAIYIPEHQPSHQTTSNHSSSLSLETVG
jgi:hypothetical protein